MVDLHCVIMWAKNSGAGLERHPTAYYGGSSDDYSK